MTHRGRYILLEGDEGAGKTTQCQALKTALEARGLTVELVREPGTDPFAEDLRGILKHATYPITTRAELLAMCAARTNLLEHRIKPTLEAGHWVISDRSFVTSYVYQGLAAGLGMEVIKPVIEFAQGGFWPDLTIIIDVQPAVSDERQTRRALATDRFDRGEDWHQAISQGFRDWPPDSRTKHVNGDLTPEAVTRQILALIDETLSSSARIDPK